MRRRWIRSSVVALAACAAPAATTTTTDTGCPHVTAFADADGDGYGDDVTAALVCEPVTGQVLVAGDCDDADAGVYPGAEDAWYDGVDADCAGNDDFDADGDGVPSTAGDCDDTDPDTAPGAADAACDGVDSDCDGIAPRCEIPFSALAGTYTQDGEIGLGNAVAFAGDMDGDGLDDLAIGAPYAGDAGAAYVVFGPATGPHTLPGDGVAIDGGGADGEEFGAVLAPAGDWDGDGDEDLWVGADGSAYLFPAPIAAPTTALDLSSSIASLYPTGTDDGRFIAGHDATGDGRPDVLSSWVSGGPNGGVYLFAGGWVGHRADPDLTVRSDNWLCQYEFGRFTDWAGDTDGDGIEEIYIGSNCDPSDGDPEGGGLIPATERGVIALGAGSAFSTFAPHVAGAAGFDANGDGHDDVAITLNEPGTGGSTLHVLHGPLPTGHVDPRTIATTTLFARFHQSSWEPAELASPGDIDLDGRDDLAFGLYDDASIGLLLGGQQGELTDEDIEVVLMDDSSLAGRPSRLATGDVDGDQVPDLLIGKSGGAWLALGKDLVFTPP